MDEIEGEPQHRARAVAIVQVPHNQAVSEAGAADWRTGLPRRAGTKAKLNAARRRVYGLVAARMRRAWETCRAALFTLEQCRAAGTALKVVWCREGR
ncbi:hypothetical protein ACRBEV_29295 [Methylobacterium phyllosphaerae]